MDPSIAADIVRCAKQRSANALTDWYQTPIGSPMAEQLDRRIAREDHAAFLLDPNRTTPYTTSEGDVITEDEPGVVKFTNGIGNEDYASSADEVKTLHHSYQLAGIPYHVTWHPVHVKRFGHKPETFNDPADTWLEDEWLDNKALAWIHLK